MIKEIQKLKTVVIARKLGHLKSTAELLKSTRIDTTSIDLLIWKTEEICNKNMWDYICIATKEKEAGNE